MVTKGDVARENMMSFGARQAIDWTEQGLVPDSIIRGAIRRLLRSRLAELRPDDAAHVADATTRFVAAMYDSPIAPLAHKANEQHYELPPDFFALALGPHRKYSSCYWGEGVDTLEQAEQQALSATCERAGLADGQRILELGCGWGSLSLWMAKTYPNARITAVSNSASQRAFILARAQERGLGNLEVVTCDMNEFEAPGAFASHGQGLLLGPLECVGAVAPVAAAVLAVRSQREREELGRQFVVLLVGLVRQRRNG